MVIGILQVELLIGEAASLKDKRRVVMSLKERLHRDLSVAVAEVDKQDMHQVAVLGILNVSNSVAHTQSVLDKVIHMLRQGRDFVLNDQRQEILSGR